MNSGSNDIAALDERSSRIVVSLDEADGLTRCLEHRAEQLLDADIPIGSKQRWSRHFPRSLDPWSSAPRLRADPIEHLLPIEAPFTAHAMRGKPAAEQTVDVLRVDAEELCNPVRSEQFVRFVQHFVEPSRGAAREPAAPGFRADFTMTIVTY